MRRVEAAPTVAVGAICGRGNQTDFSNWPPVTWRYLSYHKEMGRPCSSGMQQRSHQPESGGEESPRREQLNNATELRFYRSGMIPVLSS
jgi:hypothetical protein